MGGTNVTKARVTRHGFIIPSRLTAGMARYLFKVEYSSEKFGSFFVNAKEQPHYSFVKLSNSNGCQTADIRKTAVKRLISVKTSHLYNTLLPPPSEYDFAMKMGTLLTCLSRITKCLMKC